MTLSVIMPKLQKAQWARIDEELKDIDYELVIDTDLSQAIKRSKGSFLTIIEEDSAFTKDSIRKSVEIFVEKPSYRKLAMVSPVIDFEDMEMTTTFTYGDHDGELLGIIPPSSTEPHAVRIGYMMGAIIRTSSIKKAKLNYSKNALYLSAQLSASLWARGLRVELNPSSTYYAPCSFSPVDQEQYKIGKENAAIKVWHKEFII